MASSPNSAFTGRLRITMGQMHCSRCYCNATLVLQLYIENWLRWFPPDPGLLASFDLSNAWPSSHGSAHSIRDLLLWRAHRLCGDGKGTPVVRASHWLTHLEYELTRNARSGASRRSSEIG